MKLNEIPEEYIDRVAFACKVCRSDHKSTGGKNSNRAWRGIGKEVCTDIEKAIQQAEHEKLSADEICVACGKGYAVDGLLCPNCRKEIV